MSARHSIERTVLARTTAEKALTCSGRALAQGTDVSAKAAGLVFSSDCVPGIRRAAAGGGGFTYRHELGRPLSEDDLRRIGGLKLPPAWRDVWICDDERGHLQATGRDVRGRKQYRYHDLWRLTRDEAKYAGLLGFGEALPEIRRQVDRDLRRPGIDKRRVLALAVAVLDETLIRVGNVQYARENDSFGLTTLRDEHAEVLSTKVRLRFRGKSGKELTVASDNPRIARALRRARDLPGQELLQYVDESGEQRMIESGDVNAYLQSLAKGVGSKDFRTWGGSLTAAVSLHASSGVAPDRAIAAAVREAADVLGNTPAVCRRSYVHPGLLALYRSGRFEQVWEHAEQTEPATRFLREDERVFLGVLRAMVEARQTV